MIGHQSKQCPFCGASRSKFLTLEECSALYQIKGTTVKKGGYTSELHAPFYFFEDLNWRMAFNPCGPVEETIAGGKKIQDLLEGRELSKVCGYNYVIDYGLPELCKFRWQIAPTCPALTK